MLFKKMLSRSQQLFLLTRFVFNVFPQVDRQLSRWQVKINAAGDQVLREQGLASMKNKRFHCLGGSFYALYGKPKKNFVKFVVAFQTISDYLDNLCDRAGCLDGKAFRQLHMAFLDALDPESKKEDYYSLYPYRDDGGYLQELVEECRRIADAPSYQLIKEDILLLAHLYSDLQTYKHTHKHLRERLLQQWFSEHKEKYPELKWWEFAAASGSTLGIFALCSSAFNSRFTICETNKLLAVYFPWICGLHILLDYFIDQEEDRVGGDLNFVSYYRDHDICRERLLFFLQKSLEMANSLPEAGFHKTVIKGLLAFYLSDPKIKAQGLTKTTELLLNAGGRDAVRMHKICCFLRSLNVL